MRAGAGGCGLCWMCTGPVGVPEAERVTRGSMECIWRAFLVEKREPGDAADAVSAHSHLAVASGGGQTIA